MNIAKHINELLLKHNCVIIPGLGGFVAIYKSATIHPINHTFAPPSKEIVFNAGLKNNDGILANHIAQELKIDYASALEIIEIKVSELYKQLTSQKQIDISQLGTLSIDNQGNISFDSENDYTFYAGSFGLEEFVSPPVLRPSLKKHINKTIQKEKNKPQKIRRLNANLRWAAAAVLPLLAVVTWATFNVDYIKSYNLGNSDLLSFFFSQKNAPVLHETKTKHTVAANEMIYIYDFGKNIPIATEEVKEFIAPLYINIENNKQEFLISDNDINIETAKPIATETANNNFYIIGNCFKSLTNAEIYLTQLKDKGFAGASLAGISPTGLHRVSFASYASSEEAESALTLIRKNEQEYAWILEN